MAKFVLTAQMQLQAPTNLTQVRRQIQQQLGNVTINPVINTQALANANQQISNVGKTAAKATKNLNNASRSAQSLGASLGAAARRFASITLATGFFLGLARGISEAFGKAIEFEREILKISQVTGKSTQSLRNLTSEVTRLSTSLGVSSSELLTASRTLSQAGFSALKTKQALEVLARTDLAATFDNLADTTEGAIAILRQFRSEARATGGDIKFLEQSLDAINAVSKSFAVESADLIAAVRRTGGVFEAAGGKLNELIALFTSVRATTRETAETIATGFRTIFTRIQRTETIEQLRELGIELRNAKGEFVGPLEAIKRLQIGLAGLSATDFRFQEIIEQLGGFRQVGKVIPLLKQYDTTVQALSIANLSAGSTARDAATAQQGLGNAFEKLSEKFNATIRSIADSDTFQSLARGAISLAESILKVVKALEPLLPLLTSLAAFKLGQIAVPALGRFSGITGRNQGGQIYGFNKGGFVPGTGNRDTVPAMLTPGEFVIRKSSVNKIGAENLAAVNGYTNGTTRRGAPSGGSPVNVNPTLQASLTAEDRVRQGLIQGEAQPLVTFTPRRGVGSAIGLVAQQGGDGELKSMGGAETKLTNPKIISMIHKRRIAEERVPEGTPPPASMNAKIGKGVYDVFAPSMDDVKGGMQSLVDSGVRDGLGFALKSAINKIESAGALDIPPAMQTNEKLINKWAQPLRNDKQIVSTMSGYLFEGVLGALVGSSHTGGADAFDLPAGIFGTVLPKVQRIFGKNVRGSKAELKRSRKQLTGAAGIPKKVFNDLNAMGYTSQSGVKLTGYNKGGSVDTVPAMLTPGEYVINKKAAQSIGYGNLNRMNKSGVAHFNSGGAVQHFNLGGGPTSPNPLGAAMSGGGGANPMAQVDAAAKTLANALTSLANAVTGSVDDMNLLGMIDDNLAKASTPLFNALYNAAAGIGPLDEKINGMLTPAATTLSGEMARAGQALYAGLSVVDDQLKQQMQVAVEAIVAASANFAGGISTLDDTLRTQLQSALNPLKTVMTVLQAEMKKVGTELMKKIAVFDQLKDDVVMLQGEMQKLGQGFVEKLDDFNPIKVQVPAVATSLQFLSESIVIFVQTVAQLQSNFAGAVGTAVRSFAAMGGTAGAAVNPFAALSGPLAKTNKFVLKINTAMMGVGDQLFQLASNLANLNKNVSSGSVNIANVSGAASNTGPQIDALEQQIIKLKAELAEVQNQMNTMGNQAVTTKGPVGRGGGGGGAMAGGGMAGFGNTAMMAAFMAPMAIEFTSLSDKTKEVVQQFTMLGGILGMIGAQIGSAFGNFIAQMVFGTKVQQASNASEAAESATNIEAVATETAENVANMKAAAMSLGFGILGAAVGVVAAAFMTYNAQLKEERKRMAQSFTDFVTKIQEGAAANAAGVNEATQSMLGAFDVSDRQLRDKARARMEQVRTSVGGRGGAAAVNIDFGQVFTDELNRLEEEAGPARKTIMAMADATIAAATSVGQFNSQTKILAEKGLKGDALIKEQTRIADQFLANSRSAKNLKNEFDRLDQQFGAGRNQEAYREGVQQLNDVIAEQGKTAFRVADTIRANIQSMTQAIINGEAVFDQVKYDEQIKRLTDSLFQGFFAEAINQGKTVDQANDFAIKATNESIAARKKGDAEAIKAAQERRVELDALAKAEVRLMQMERLRAMVMNKLAVNMALANNQFSSATNLIKSFGGTVADTKISIKEITDTLKNGFDKRAIEAAKKVSPSIAKNIEEGLKKNKNLQTAFDALALTTKGRKLGRQESKDALDRVGIDFEGLDQDVKAQLLELMKDGFDAADVEKATELLGVNVSNQIKLLQDLANAQQKFISTLAESSKQMLAANKDILKARQFELDVRIKGAERIRKALGREITVREAGAQIRARAAAAAGIRGPVNVGGLQNRAAGLIRRRTDVAERRFAGQVNAGGPLAGRAAERDQRLANAQNALNAEIEKTKDALKILADQSDKAAAVMAEIDKEREGREAIASSVKDFTFASNEQRRTMNQEFAALTRVLQTGNLNAIPDQMRAAVGKLLDQFKNVDFGGGLTGGDISKRLQVRQLEQNFRMMSGGRQGAPPQLIKAIFNATTKEEKLINDLRKINQEEQQAAEALRQLEEQEANLMIKVLTRIEEFLRKVMQSIQSTTETGANIDDAAAGGAAVGGIVPVRGFARGGNVFKPRGTDTVPAMLTPGEFVIRKSAVDKIGIGALTSLNNGNVSTVYKNAGGLIEQNVGQLISGSMIAKGNILPNAINAMLIKEGKANAFGRQLQKYDQKDMEKLFGNTMRTVAFLNNYATGYGITKIKERQGINYGRIIAGPGQTMGLANNGAIVLNPALRSGGYLTPAGIFTAIMNNPNEFANKRYNHAAVQQQGLNGPLHKQRIAAATFKSRKQDQTIKKAAAFKVHAEKARSGVEGLLNAYYNPQFFADMATLESIFTQGSGVRFEGTEKFALANVQGLARGGSVDSVPAMLTPGEFVMSRAAVKKHGTGFMNSVNRGKIPGFARGGSVGGVQYRNGGGILSSIGSGMMDAISKSLSSFEGLANILNNVASLFSDMSISHTVQVDGTLNIPGFSQQAINNIVKVIGESVVSQTEDKIDIALEEFTRKLNQRSD